MKLHECVLIRCFYFPVFENNDKIVIVMEYAAGGELYDYLSARKGVENEEARRFFSQIVSAIQYCHQVGAMVIRYLFVVFSFC